MKTDTRIQDLKRHVVYIKNDININLDKPHLSKSKRKSRFKGDTASIYNENFSCMPTNDND